MALLQPHTANLTPHAACVAPEKTRPSQQVKSITAKRMISGLVLKYLNGECFVIRRGYETTLPVSSSFCLTVPSEGNIYPSYARIFRSQCHGVRGVRCTIPKPSLKKWPETGHLNKWQIKVADLVDTFVEETLELISLEVEQPIGCCQTNEDSHRIAGAA